MTFRQFLMTGLLLMGATAAIAGGNTRVALLLNPGSPARQNIQMAERMERDLKNVLERRGNFTARILRSHDEFKTGANEYLLNVRIVRYNAGSKAARIIVGFGAGTATFDIHYELVGPAGNTLLSKDDGCATSLDWQRLARKMNENILAAVEARLAAGRLDEDLAATPAATEPAPAPVPVPPPPETVPPSQAAPPTPAAPDVTGSAPEPEAATTPSRSAVEQLRELETLRKENLISEEEYRVKRKRILDRF
jgi:hypothetical protein